MDHFYTIGIGIIYCRAFAFGYTPYLRSVRFVKLNTVCQRGNYKAKVRFVNEKEEV